MGRSSAKSQSGVSVLHDGKASVHDQLREAERLVQGACGGGASGAQAEDTPGLQSPYAVLRQLHRSREVLDWLVSPRGLARFYKSKETAFGVFLRMWSVLRQVLVGPTSVSGDPRAASLGAWQVDESFAPARTFPVVVTRMVEGLRLYGGSPEACVDVPWEAYGVLSDVMEVLCAGVRKRAFVVTADAALRLLDGAALAVLALRSIQSRDGKDDGIVGGEEGDVGQEKALRFAAFVSEFFVLQMRGGRWEPGKMKHDMIERVSQSAFYDGRGACGETLREHCGEILRWAMFADADGTKKKDLKSLASWAGSSGVHPRFVSWMIEEYPSGSTGAVGSAVAALPWGQTVSEVFFGFAEAYMDTKDCAGLSRLLGALKVRGRELYRTVGDGGPAMFARLTRVSDFLIENAHKDIVSAMKGLDYIVAVEHRGIEQQIEAYWSLLDELGNHDKDALCRSTEVLFSEYNRLRRLDVLFKSIKIDANGGSVGTRDASNLWDMVIRLPDAMASIRRVLGQIPTGQSVRFVDQVGEWIGQSCDLMTETVSEMACAVLDSVPVDPNNVLSVAKHLRGVLERARLPETASKRRSSGQKSSKRRKQRHDLFESSSALAVVTKLLDVHGRCCRIDPNISPMDHIVPVELINNMLASLKSNSGNVIVEGSHRMSRRSVARGLVAGIVYHLKVECEALSRSQCQVIDGSNAEQHETSPEASTERRAKTQRSADHASTIAFLAASLGDVVTSLNGTSPPVALHDLLNVDEWWFELALECLEMRQRDALVRQLLSPTSPVHGGRAFCMRHVDKIIEMAPAREDPEWAGAVPIFAEDMDPAAVLAHYKLMAPSVGVSHANRKGDAAINNAIHELCMAHCAHALAASPRDASHVICTVRDVVCQAKQSTDVIFDRIRSSVVLLDMAMGSSALMELDVPESLDDTSIEAAIELGELVSDEVEACSMSSLAAIIEEEDSPVASLMAIRGLLRAERAKSEATKRVICNTLVETAREKLNSETIGDHLVTVAALAGAYAAALRARIVSEEMIALVPDVFKACTAVLRIAFRRNLASLANTVSGFLEAYAFIATSSKPRMSSTGAAHLLGALLALLRDAPWGIGAGHMCRPNAPKEAMAIAASGFDARGKTRRCVIRVLDETVAGSTRDECISMLELVLQDVSLEHAELLLVMLEDAGNGVLRELLDNQVDAIVYRLVQTLEELRALPIDICLPSSKHRHSNTVSNDSDGYPNSQRLLKVATVLRCLESISCRPARFTKLSKRAMGTILSTVQCTLGLIAWEEPGRSKDACFDGACHLVRGILRHQATAVGRFLHLVAGVVAALQSTLAMEFLIYGDASAHLMEGLSRVLEEFAKIRAVQPYLKDALLTHVKLFMSPIARTSLDQCLSKKLAAMVPEDRIGQAVVPIDAQGQLSPGIAALYGSLSEDDIQDVYACLSSRSHASEWRLRLEDLQGLYERQYKFRGKI